MITKERDLTMKTTTPKRRMKRKVSRRVKKITGAVGVSDKDPLTNREGAAAELGCGISMISALKHAAGIKGHYFYLSVIRDFLRRNPGFTEASVYGPNSTRRKPRPDQNRSETAGNPDAP